MKIGTTSFTFRTALRDPQRAPSLLEIAAQCREIGLERLQVCENARPLALSSRAWERLIQQSADRGVELQLGCKTLNEAELDQHLLRAAATPARLLRLVLEEEEGRPPSRAFVFDFIASLVPKLTRHNIGAAIENHFDIPARVLAEAVNRHDSPLLGFCVDSANSLRSFEPAAYVLEQLGPRAFCCHVKDYKVVGHQLGFCVTGAPLGEGDLPLDEFLDAVLSRAHPPELFVETWVIAKGDWAADVAEDMRWLKRSTETLRARLAARG